MLGLGPGIHVFRAISKDVDGRPSPAMMRERMSIHDGKRRSPPRLPPPRLHLVWRPGGTYRLLPRRVRRTPPLGAGGWLRRPGCPLPVHAGPGIEPAWHVDRPVARRAARHVR